MNDEVKPEIKIAGLPIQRASAKAHRISLLLWGDAGTGKTSLACTAPGRKLLLNFDVDGDSSIAHRDDVDVIDFSSVGCGITEKFKSSNPLGLKTVL